MDSELISSRPHIPHTELEEELHETAHIDYDRVSIVRVPFIRWHLVTASSSPSVSLIRSCLLIGCHRSPTLQ